MTIKERLAKVDKKVWVGIVCIIFTILFVSFFVFNDIGKIICLHMGRGFVSLIIVALMLRLYIFILMKMGLLKENPISVKFSCKINKQVSSDEGCEPSETTIPEEANNEAEITVEDEET